MRRRVSLEYFILGFYNRNFDNLEKRINFLHRNFSPKEIQIGTLKSVKNVSELVSQRSIVHHANQFETQKSIGAVSNITRMDRELSVKHNNSGLHSKKSTRADRKKDQSKSKKSPRK